MSRSDETPIEYEFLRETTLADIIVPETRVTPTSADDKHTRIECRLGGEDEDGELANDVEHFAFAFIYALAALSFADARPRGVSNMDFRRTIDRRRATCFAGSASSWATSISMPTMYAADA